MIGTRSIDDIRVLGARHDPAPLTANIDVLFRSSARERVSALLQLRWQSSADPRVNIVPFDPSLDSDASRESIEAEEIIPPWQWESNAIRIACSSEAGDYSVLLHVYSMGVESNAPRGLCRGIGEYPIPGVTNNVQ